MMSFRLAGRVFRLAGREFPKIALILVPGHLQCSSLLQSCFLYEEQQEAKRPKSPAKEDVQQAEQHGSGGECGEEMETDMSEILLLYGPAHFVMTNWRLYRIHNYSTSLSRVDINALSTLWGVR